MSMNYLDSQVLTTSTNEPKTLIPKESIMADITIRRAHGMDHAQAKDKVHQIVDELDYVDKANWSGDGSKADIKGKGFKGDVEVTDTELVVNINLKLFAKPLKGKIEDQINKRMDSYFA